MLYIAQYIQINMEHCILVTMRRVGKWNSWVRRIMRVNISRRMDEEWSKEALEWYPRNLKKVKRTLQERWVDEIKRRLG